MNVSKLLIIISVILFGVGFVLILTGNNEAKTVSELLMLGLACFAGAHAFP